MHNTNNIYFVSLVRTDGEPFIFSGMLEISCTKDIKIQGIIGPCSSLEKVISGMLTIHFLRCFVCAL